MSRRILIVHNDYQLAGGESNVAESDARLLTAHGDAVFFYRRDNREIASYSALQKLRLAFATFFSLRTVREVRALIRKERIDVVHVHNTVPLISPSVYYAAWAENVPVVQTVHNYRLLCPNGMCYRDGRVCEECITHGLTRAVRYGCYRNSRAQSAILAGTIALHRLLGTYRRVEAYICLTPFGREKLAKKLPVTRLYIKPNTVQTEIAPLPYEAHGNAYVFLGRLDPEKGVWVLLKAFERLPDAALTIVGGGPEEAAMRAYITQHGMQNVTMAGQLSHAEALSCVASARALVMPTQWYEGLPLTVLEAFALGTPVIGSLLGNVGATLSEYGGGVAFDQTSPEALATCIRTLADERLARASEQGLAAARGAFAPERNYETLCEIYDAALARRGGGA